MEISTQKRLYKLTIDKKAFGEIEVAAKTDTKDIILYARMRGEYDKILNFDTVKIKNAMEVLFDEKCRENIDSVGDGLYRAQD